MPNAEFYMRRALELAKRGWGATSPNPMVGAVLVKNGRIIAEGWHTKDGAAHAEIECLRNASESPKGADLYVTLEPCSTRGRTGACCDAIISAGIARVFAATKDPSPAHSGRAEQILKSHSIECSFGILEEQAKRLNFIFNESITSQKAIIALKYAMSSDGKIAAKRGERTRITGEDAAADVMKWRSLFQSIGVGFGTLLADNPRLTARVSGKPEKCPVRLIFDAKLSTAELPDISAFHVFSDEFASRTRVVCAMESDPIREKSLAERGIAVMRVPEPSDSPLFWDFLKKSLLHERISSLYIEGGARILQSCCAAKAAEFAFEYVNDSLRLGDSALSVWEGKRPFEFVSPQEFNFGNDRMRFGKIKYR